MAKLYFPNALPCLAYPVTTIIPGKIIILTPKNRPWLVQVCMTDKYFITSWPKDIFTIDNYLVLL